MKKFWEVVRGALLVIGVIAVARFAFIGFFCEPTAHEPYDRHKMSQVVVPPPKPLWQKPRDMDVGRGQLQRITENLRHGLDNLPQYPWRDFNPPQVVFVPYPWKEYQSP